MSVQILSYSIFHRKKTPKDERVLVFVQFPDLMKKVAEAFDAHKVQYLEIKGSASQKIGRAHV